MNSATGRNTINTDNYIFYFSKLLTSKGIKIQSDVLTKEKFVTNSLKYGGLIMGNVGLILWIYETFKPDTTVKTVARAVTRVSHFTNRTPSSMNSAYGEEHDGTSSIYDHGTSSIYNHGTSSNHWASPKYWAKQKEYMDEETEALNKKK